jgi:hypothetical protein
MHADGVGEIAVADLRFVSHVHSRLSGKAILKEFSIEPVNIDSAGVIRQRFRSSKCG